jgi:hypothetical protein
LNTVGEATFTIKDDSLTIAGNASELPKDIEHWRHFDGFTDGRQATCPAKAADANGDGIIDVPHGTLSEGLGDRNASAQGDGLWGHWSLRHHPAEQDKADAADAEEQPVVQQDVSRQVADVVQAQDVVVNDPLDQVE